MRTVGIENFEAALDDYRKSHNVYFASWVGAANFTPSLIPHLETRRIECPYRNLLYVKAWQRGFYSAAAWYLREENERLKARGESK